MTPCAPVSPNASSQARWAVAPSTTRIASALRRVPPEDRSADERRSAPRSPPRQTLAEITYSPRGAPIPQATNSSGEKSTAAKSENV